MTISPILIQQRARHILATQTFCLYHDPRFPTDGIARRGDGIVTAPENKPAVQFTLIGAVAKATFELHGSPWTKRPASYEDDYHNAMWPLWSRVSFDHMTFLRLCDKMGRDRCIKLLDEVLEI